jgi:hypothetical protein
MKNFLKITLVALVIAFTLSGCYERRAHRWDQREDRRDDRREDRKDNH